MSKKDITGDLLRLANGLKFVVLKQMLYKDINYFYVMRVTDNEQDIIEQYDILEEVIVNEKTLVRTTKDPELRLKLVEIFIKEIAKED